MAWDSSKSPGDLITAKIWNDMVSDQKNHAGRHADDGSDALGTDAVTSTQIEAGSVGTSELDESASFDFSSTVSMDGGIDTGSGDLSINPSGDVDVNSNTVKNVSGFSESSNIIGVDELDESANFSFSNLGATTITGDLDMSNGNIDDVASIDGGGNAIGANDSFDLNNKHSVINLNRGENEGGSGIEWSLDSSLNAEAGKASLYIGDDDTPDIEWQRNANIPTAFRVLDRTNVNVLMDLNDSGTLDLPQGSLNMVQSNSIQDAGTDAIQFNGSGVATFPNNVKLNGFNVKHTANRSWFFDQETNNSMLMRNLGGGDFVVQTTNASGGSTDRLRLNGGVDTAEVNIENANLELNGNNINDVASIDGGGDEIEVNDKLTVKRGGDEALKVESDFFTGLRIRSSRDSSSDHSVINMGASRGTISSPKALNSTDTIATFRPRGYDGGAFQILGDIKATATEDYSAGNTGQKWVFETIPNGSSVVQSALTITQDAKLNLEQSTAIQDEGTDAIQFDGSANVTIPNGSLTVENTVDVQGGSDRSLESFFETNTTSSHRFEWNFGKENEPLLTFEDTTASSTKKHSLGINGSTVGVALDASNNFSDAEFRIQTDSIGVTGGTELFTVTDEGNVSIPKGNLDLNSNTIDGASTVKPSNAANGLEIKNQTIADDSVATYDVAGLSLIFIQGADSQSRGSGIFLSGFDSLTTVQLSNMTNEGGNTTLSGTTSTDGNINVSRDDNTIYVENRTGAQEKITVTGIGD